MHFVLCSTIRKNTAKNHCSLHFDFIGKHLWVSIGKERKMCEGTSEKSIRLMIDVFIFQSMKSRRRKQLNARKGFMEI